MYLYNISFYIYFSLGIEKTKNCLSYNKHHKMGIKFAWKREMMVEITSSQQPQQRRATHDSCPWFLGWNVLQLPCKESAWGNLPSLCMIVSPAPDMSIYFDMPVH